MTRLQTFSTMSLHLIVCISLWYCEALSGEIEFAVTRPETSNEKGNAGPPRGEAAEGVQVRLPEDQNRGKPREGVSLLLPCRDIVRGEPLCTIIQITLTDTDGPATDKRDPRWGFRGEGLRFEWRNKRAGEKETGSFKPGVGVYFYLVDPHKLVYEARFVLQTKKQFLMEDGTKTTDWKPGKTRWQPLCDEPGDYLLRVTVPLGKELCVSPDVEFTVRLASGIERSALEQFQQLPPLWDPLDDGSIRALYSADPQAFTRFSATHRGTVYARYCSAVIGQVLAENLGVGGETRLPEKLQQHLAEALKLPTSNFFRVSALLSSVEVNALKGDYVAAQRLLEEAKQESVSQRVLKRVAKSEAGIKRPQSEPARYR